MVLDIECPQKLAENLLPGEELRVGKSSLLKKND